MHGTLPPQAHGRPLEIFHAEVLITALVHGCFRQAGLKPFHSPAPALSGDVQWPVHVSLCALGVCGTKYAPKAQGDKNDQEPRSRNHGACLSLTNSFIFLKKNSDAFLWFFLAGQVVPQE